jgi:DNA invertase Pin-like site-specific DNA recombinase
VIYAYARVSTEEQGESGLGLAAQAASLDHWAAGKPYELVEEIASGGRADRPVLQALIARLEEGDTLAVAKLDRLTRNVRHLCDVLSDSQKRGWYFAALDLGVDTRTAGGRMVAQLFAVISEWERGIISERTRAAMQAKLRENPDAFKKPERAISDEARAFIRKMSDNGMTHREIVTQLNNLAIPTAQGGEWRPGTISYLLSKAT